MRLHLVPVTRNQMQFQVNHAPLLMKSCQLLGNEVQSRASKDLDPPNQSAWPIHGLYDHRLGELLSVSEALYIASQQLEKRADSPALAGKTVVVRIFNDNQRNLEFLQGAGVLDLGLVTMAAPVLRSILLQSESIHKLGIDVRLELHWIPGHKHSIKPHALADKLAEEASWYMPEIRRFPRCPRQPPALPEIGGPGAIAAAVTATGVLVAYLNTTLPGRLSRIVIIYLTMVVPFVRALDVDSGHKGTTNAFLFAPGIQRFNV
ncbi:hypothetical protein B0I37DRAFT_432945 [Chaetomium sp. MPI-CAGE-AT-0009]|nr:hypothetical protein B0I37DRAFT_432945 [Chaetomium sp. MPI-CAGE-AT-0009]